MFAKELVEKYALGRDIEPGTVWWFGFVLARFGRHVGRSPEPDDFQAAIVNAWLAAMLAEGLARRTVNGYRGGLLVLWRWAHDEGLVERPATKIKKIKVPTTVPVGWSTAEVDRLLTEAAKVPGKFLRSKVIRAAFWRALILVIWDSGLRLGDALRLRRSDFNDAGVGSLTQKKTGWAVHFRLRSSTMKAVAAMFPPERELIFGGVLCRPKIFQGMAKIAKAAGVQGGTKKLRKGGASYVERAHRGASQSYLGHRTPGLAARHYLDPSIVGNDPPQPPELTG